MNRDEKIEALLEQLLDKGYFSYEECIKSCIRAGIKLRDEELLELLPPNEESVRQYWQENGVTVKELLDVLISASKVQHEQFMKAIKGDGDENT